MKFNKHILRKTLFITVFVIGMFLLESVLSSGLNLDHNLSFTVVLSSSVWAYVASCLYDKLYKRKLTEQVSSKVLENLREIKEILNK